MSPLDKVLDALRATGATPKGSGTKYTCRCPAHDDKNPSLSINVGDDGRVLLNCHANCSTEDVVRAAGLEMADLFDRPASKQPERRQHRHKPTTYATVDEAIATYSRSIGSDPSHRWPYHNEKGDVVGYAVRWDLPDGKKTLRPVSLIEGRWQCAGMPAPRPLYRMRAVQDADTVYVVEGEKAADALGSCGLTATTSAHGAKAAADTDWTTVRGKRVVVCPDRNDVGRQYAREVSRLCLDAGAASVRVIELADRWNAIPTGGDAADVLPIEGGDAEAVRRGVEALADEATPQTHTERDNSIRPLREFGDRIEYQLLPVTQLGPAEEPDWLWPGYIARESTTLLTGLWKAGKTTLIKYLLRDLVRGGGLADSPIDAPVLLVSEESQSLWAERRESLGLDESVLFLKRDGFARPNQQQWDDFIGALSSDVRERGIGLVIFDTLPHIWPVLEENSAGETLEALMPVRNLTEAGAGVLLIHHPRKSDGNEATATRGSGALTGFVDTIVELRRYDAQNHDDSRRVLTGYGRFDSTPVERVIELGPNGYEVLGDRVDARSADTADTIVQTLPPAESEGLTVDEVREKWPTKPLPGKTSLTGALKRGFKEGHWSCTGRGVKGEPFRYRRLSSDTDSIRSGPSLRERIESEAIIPPHPGMN